jgi:hypothetical protein
MMTAKMWKRCRSLGTNSGGIQINSSHRAIAITQLEREHCQLPPAKAAGVDAGGSSDRECAVCLGTVGDDGPATRKLTACRHVFHKHCIEQWLHAHPAYPICRCNARQDSLEVVVRQMLDAFFSPFYLDPITLLRMFTVWWRIMIDSVE